MLVKKYVKQLISNLPEKNEKIPIEIDLVLSGGSFNGSYTIGALYYIKELEKQNAIKVKRISGSSIGSILGLLYFSNKLYLFNTFYSIFFENFNKNKNLSQMLELKELMKNKIPSNICDILNGRFYVCFNNIQLCKKYVKHKYTNIDKLLDYIIRSCYVPFFIDYNPSYKNKYIDGLLPYIFTKKNNRKILYINVFTYDKLSNIINVKNESSNLHRILTGIIDIHIFFIKEQNTIMCSYIENWVIYDYFIYYLTYLLENIFMYIMYLTKKINNTKKVKNSCKQIVQYLISFLNR